MATDFRGYPQKEFFTAENAESAEKDCETDNMLLSVLRDLCGKYEAVNILIICIYLRPKKYFFTYHRFKR